MRRFTLLLLFCLSASAVGQPEVSGASQASDQPPTGPRQDAPANADEPGIAPLPTDRLRVGTKVAPPFVTKDADGSFSGISVELWRQVAQAMDVDFEWIETDLNGLLEGLQTGELDASVAALTVTAEREAVIDFSHPFHTTGLAVAVHEKGSPIVLTLKRLFSLEFLASLSALVGVLMLVGLLLWLAERHKNKAMFGGKPAQGIGSSFWWAAVTMTTVGYGDKAPVTFWGRMIALIWMFAAIIIISSFTAAIATSLTVGQLESSITSVDDLDRARVATIANSSAENWLERKNFDYDTFTSVPDGLRMLENKQLDALVYDKPILQYELNRGGFDHLKILPNTFLRQDYAIALPKDSALREEMNQALLRAINAQQWQQVLEQHLGNLE